MTIIDVVLGARRSLIACALLMQPLIASCTDGDEKIVVFAASSLRDAFDRVESEFEESHPGVDVVVSYGGSSSLATQLGDGAPVDVLATADLATMERASRQTALAGPPIRFATNTMVIAVERGNPLAIDGLASLTSVPVVVLAAPDVPAGAYATALIDRAGVSIEVSSYEPSVRSVASKVALGEADAGLVYRTDIDERMSAVEIESSGDVVAEYYVAAVTADAVEFIAFVTGDRGRAALSSVGFGLP